MYLDLHNVEILNNDTSICSGSSVMLTAIATGLGTGSACQLSELPRVCDKGFLRGILSVEMQLIKAEMGTMELFMVPL